MDEASAIRLGLDNRLDLSVSEGRVYDAQRAVVVKADALGAELTLFGQARLGESRSLSTASLANASLRPSRGIYTGLFTLDLPFERTAERIAFRDSYIALERALREFQKLEDQIKLSIRRNLREMAEAREAFIIQTNAVALAEERVKGTEIFFEAGRGVLRDVTEAQDALLTARNALSAAAVDYRLAELKFQRDTGLLEIEKTGLLREYDPRGNDNGK
ncbi:MAG: TolC family protein [Deltaproteobacteria bacterium]|nr:TolC family protein [Deltaproteobacteria bacterium]